MLTEAENAVIELIKTSPIGDKLRQVASLPDIDDDNLVKNFASDAPAVYVAPSPRMAIADGVLHVSFGVACVVRNAAGQAKTRKGDGIAIGLYELAEFIGGLLDGFNANTVTLYANDLSFMDDEKLVKAGLQVAVITLSGRAALGNTINVEHLADFLRMNSQYDLEPFAGAAEHEKWLEEPPDHSASKPKLTDEMEIQ